MAQTSSTSDNTHTDNTSLLRALSNQMADAVEQIAPALVLVNGRRGQGASGVVYAQNIVLTADHVLDRETDITVVTADSRTLPAQFVGRDRTTDLAVLRVPNLGVAPATFTQETARVGQLVIAVGRTANDGPMASTGIVSTVGGPLRTQQGATIERYIRTDAIPYPGFSGGPLIDVRGHVLGVLTTGLINGVPLAIPMNIADRIADTLLKHGTIKRGYLGISSQLVELPAAQRGGRTQEHGLLIVNVEENSPAQRGGILLGDILLTLDGHVIHDSEDLHVVLTGERVGKAIPVEIIRGNTLQTLSVTVGERK
jgi:S1-C subfamily serine protease